MFTGNVVYAGGKWLLTILIARRGGVEMLGLFGVALAFTGPPFKLLEMKLSTLYASGARLDTSPTVYIGTYVLNMVGAATVAISAAVAFGLGAELLLVIALVALWKAIDTMGHPFYAIMQRGENLRPYSRSLVLKGVTFAPAAAFGLIVGGSLMSALGAMAACALLILLLHDMPVGIGMIPRTSLPPRFFSDIPQLIIYAWPLGAVAGITSFATNIPIYFLEAAGARETIGHYVALAHLIVALNLVGQSLGAATIARLGRAFRAGKEVFVALLVNLSAAGAAISLGAILTFALIGDWILVAAYGYEFGGLRWALVLFAFGALAGMTSVHIGYGQVLLEQVGVQIPINAIAALSGCLLAMVLVPQGGVIGAVMVIVAISWIKLLLGVRLLVMGIRKKATVQQSW